jgi:hypothetical protein
VEVAAATNAKLKEEAVAVKKAREEEEDRAHQVVSSPQDMFFCSISEWNLVIFCLVVVGAEAARRDRKLIRGDH